MDEEKRNLFLFFIISILIMVGYPYFFGDKGGVQTAPQNVVCETCNTVLPAAASADAKIIARKNSSTAAKVENIEIKAARVSGTICSKGIRFNDIRLKDYKKDLDGNEKVSLFGDENSKNYYAQTGWRSDDSAIILPDQDSCWEVSGTELSENSPITFTWDNGEGLKFEKKISIDDNFLITI